MGCGKHCEPTDLGLHDEEWLDVETLLVGGGGAWRGALLGACCGRLPPVPLAFAAGCVATSLRVVFRVLKPCM